MLCQFDMEVWKMGDVRLSRRPEQTNNQKGSYPRKLSHKGQAKFVFQFNGFYPVSEEARQGF